MNRFRGLTIIGLVLAIAPSLPAGSMTSGTWKLTTLASIGNTENTSLLFTVDNIAGKMTARLHAASPGLTRSGMELVSFSLTGDYVRMVLKDTSEQVFEGR